ncbi:ATP-binding protein [Streptomyces rhizosphaericus]|uniref:ATP-binding protein n=1 Tax=Streptomyces rhizosphaericus TaxID=114699 RepID=UPI001181186E|nr:ATP-binding protein [Streptomyces rhizosphaericus]
MSTVEVERPTVRDSFRLSVPNDLSAPKIARDMVAYLLVLTGHSNVADTARILVSEVVTNVHQHTTTLTVHIDVSVKPARVSVAVWDDKPHTCPVVRTVSSHEERGRGLRLVTELSAAWGVAWSDDPNQKSKRVWFSLTEPNREGTAA